MIRAICVLGMHEIYDSERRRTEEVFFHLGDEISARTGLTELPELLGAVANVYPSGNEKRRMASDGLIDPESFDVIVLGTGLQEAMLAAAAAASRLSVLHLDPHDFYGAHWTSLDFKQFSSWAASGGCFSVPCHAVRESEPVEDAVKDIVESAHGLSEANLGDNSGGSATNSGSGHRHVLDHTVAELVENCTLPVGGINNERTEAIFPADPCELEEIELESGKVLFSKVEVCEHEGESLGLSRLYSIDLCGPRLTFCGSNLVNLLLRSGASNYVEFKGVDASYIWTGTGMSAVPSSRADVFKDKSLSLPDKRILMRFFKLVTDYATSEGQLTVDISAQDLDVPFLDFMQRQRLPSSIQSYRAVPTGGHGIIFYAITLVDEDQQRDIEDSSALLKTRDGLQKLALYLSSVARFPNATGAFLYPLYGQGELPQAFCRSAAVNGALYVLRRPVKSLLLDKDSKEYIGVRTVQGQVLCSKRLIMGPSVLPTVTGVDVSSRLDSHCTHPISSASSAMAFPVERAAAQVARCVCIIDRSLSEGENVLLVIFPPRSVYKNGSNTIRALQLSSAASVCPQDKYVVQLSTTCTDETEGRKALEAAVLALFASPYMREAESSEPDSGMNVSNKPKVLWSIFYVQALQTSVEKIPGVTICKMPDGTLDGENMLAETEKLFREMFPDEDFFPQTSAPEDPAENYNTEDT